MIVVNHFWVSYPQPICILFRLPWTSGFVRLENNRTEVIAVQTCGFYFKQKPLMPHYLVEWLQNNTSSLRLAPYCWLFDSLHVHIVTFFMGRSMLKKNSQSDEGKNWNSNDTNKFLDKWHKLFPCDVDDIWKSIF